MLWNERFTVKETAIATSSVSVVVVRPTELVAGVVCLMDGVMGAGRVLSVESDVCSCLLCLLSSRDSARTFAALIWPKDANGVMVTTSSQYREPWLVSERITFDGGGVDGMGCAMRVKGGVFDGGGGRIKLIKANCFNDGGGGRVPFDGGGSCGGVLTSNGVVRFNDGGGGPFDGGGGGAGCDGGGGVRDAACCVSDGGVCDRGFSNAAAVRSVGTSDVRIDSRDCFVVVCVNGLAGQSKCCVSTASTLLCKGGGVSVVGWIGRVHSSVQCVHQYVCWRVLIGCDRVGSKDSVVGGCGIVNCVVRVCWFGCFVGCVSGCGIVLSIASIPGVTLFASSIGSAVGALLAFILICSFDTAVCISTAALLCIVWNTCCIAATIPHSNDCCYSGASCGMRTRLVCRVHSAGYRRACTTITVAMHAIVGFK